MENKEPVVETPEAQNDLPEVERLKGEVQFLKAGEFVTPLTKPEVQIAVADLLPAR